VERIAVEDVGRSAKIPKNSNYKNIQKNISAQNTVLAKHRCQSRYPSKPASKILVLVLTLTDRIYCSTAVAQSNNSTHVFELALLKNQYLSNPVNTPVPKMLI